GSEAFTRWTEPLARELFGLEWQDVPDDHELWRINFKVDPRPHLRYISNGSRILWVHSPQDISQYWQTRADRTHREAFETGVNLFLWAAGRADLRNRLNSPYLPEPTSPRRYTLRLARLRHGTADNQWDPEPLAWQRFGRWFKYETGYSVSINNITPMQLNRQAHDLAHLTGIGPYATNVAEIAAIRDYVQSGGTLLVDACGGSNQFMNDFRATLLKQIFPEGTLVPIAPGHPLLAGAGEGMESLGKLAARPYAE